MIFHGQILLNFAYHKKNLWFQYAQFPPNCTVLPRWQLEVKEVNMSQLVHTPLSYIKLQYKDIVLEAQGFAASVLAIGMIIVAVVTIVTGFMPK